MDLDAGILISAIATMGGVVAFLWKQIAVDTKADQVSLTECLGRERDLLKRLADSGHKRLENLDRHEDN